MPVASANSASASSARLWWTSPPADDQRAAGGTDRADRLRELGRVGARTAYDPGALGEELVGPVVGLGLDVLGQREGDRARLHRVGEDAHRLEGRRDQGLGAGDAVEVPRHRAQGVVDRHIARVGDLELLEHRVGDAGREDVAGEQEHREVVDGGERGAGDQVGRAGADRRRHRVGGQAVRLAGVADGRVDHRLLVAALVERHVVAVLDQRLAEAADVPVAEDAPGRADQPLPYAVALRVLGGEEADECLGDRQPRRRGLRRHR